MEIQRNLLSLDENGKKIKRRDMLPTEGAGEEGEFTAIRLTQRRRNSSNPFDDGEDKKDKKNRKS
jgi:hypothetical protein